MGMTREEAIKYGIAWLKDEYLDAKDGAFIKKAIEALEQQDPCNDCISRQADVREDDVDIAIRALEQELDRDCERYSRAYGTLGCCTTVSQTESEDKV